MVNKLGHYIFKRICKDQSVLKGKRPMNMYGLYIGPKDIQGYIRDYTNYGIDYTGDDNISAYTQGEFTDLCRGPHVSQTGKIKYFKLLNTSGAYWRGNENNKMLQRIYGTSFSSKKDLN